MIGTLIIAVGFIAVSGFFFVTQIYGGSRKPEDLKAYTR